MKNMNAFESWQVVVLIMQIVIMLATLLAAYYVGLKQVEIAQKQNEINARLLKLQDYVAVSVEPNKDEGVIDLWNTGKSNVYLWGFDVPGNNQRLKKPRLLSIGHRYWIPLPNLGKISTTTDFEFKLYLTDEYDSKWISEAGGKANPIEINREGKVLPAVFYTVWSYKTYKEDWKI